MKMKTLTDYPLALGEALRRADLRAKRRQKRASFVRRLLGKREPRTNVVRFEGGETVFSEGR